MTDNALQELKMLVDGSVPLDPEEWKAFSSVWKSYTAKRKELITREGESERYLYFVLSGVQRVFYMDTEGREASLIFTYAPSFGGVLDSMLLGGPSSYFYEAITHSEFLRAPYDEIKPLMDQYKNINLLIFNGVSFALKGVLGRMAELQCFSSEEKFRTLLARSPHILQQVPHKYLANYLGIDPTNFSKLINKVLI